MSTLRSQSQKSDEVACPSGEELAYGVVAFADWHQGEKISANLRRKIECYAVIKGTDVAKDEYVCYQDLYTCGRKKAPERADARGGEHTDPLDGGLLTISSAQDRKHQDQSYQVGPGRAQTMWISWQHWVRTRESC